LRWTFFHPPALTFTHSRPITADLFDEIIKNEAIVRARITMTLDNFAALRDLLVRTIITSEASNASAPAAGGAGSTRH
jgi:hypothetical protein